MILYKCICGQELVVSENSEAARAGKRAFKKAHDKKQPGHKWTRLVMKRR